MTAATYTDPVQGLLSRLAGVRRTTAGRWVALCPAHDDGHPSLSVAEGTDGRVLLRCWAGCSADSIVAAVGLDLRDLFPRIDRAPGAGTAPVRRPWSAADLLDLAAHEATVIVVALGDVLDGDDSGADRLQEAARRLIDMQEAAHAR